MRGFVAAALLGGVALTGAAQAQDAGDGGMNCVYSELIDNYDLVAEVFIYGDISKEETDEAAQAVEAAKKSCAAIHDYSPDQLVSASDIGVLASALDYLSEDLLFSGVSEDVVDAILEAYDTLTEMDIDAIFDAIFDVDWRSDAAFYGKMRAKMVGAGVPDDAVMMDIAMAILEITALVEESTLMFMLDEQ